MRTLYPPKANWKNKEKLKKEKDRQEALAAAKIESWQVAKAAVKAVVPKSNTAKALPFDQAARIARESVITDSNPELPRLTHAESFALVSEVAYEYNPDGDPTNDVEAEPIA